MKNIPNVIIKVKTFQALLNISWIIIISIKFASKPKNLFLFYLLIKDIDIQSLTLELKTSILLKFKFCSSTESFETDLFFC